MNHLPCSILVKTNVGMPLRVQNDFKLSGSFEWALTSSVITNAVQHELLMEL